jgi:hypothetical protein
VIMDVSPTSTVRRRKSSFWHSFMCLVYGICKWFTRFSTRATALGQWIADKKIRVGKINLPVIQNIFLFILVFYEVTANVNCQINHKRWRWKRPFHTILSHNSCMFANFGDRQ